MNEPWKCPDCGTWIAPGVKEHRCDDGLGGIPARFPPVPPRDLDRRPLPPVPPRPPMPRPPIPSRPPFRPSRPGLPPYPGSPPRFQSGIPRVRG